MSRNVGPAHPKSGADKANQSDDDDLKDSRAEEVYAPDRGGGGRRERHGSSSGSTDSGKAAGKKERENTNEARGKLSLAEASQQRAAGSDVAILRTFFTLRVRRRRKCSAHTVSIATSPVKGEPEPRENAELEEKPGAWLGDPRQTERAARRGGSPASEKSGKSPELELRTHDRDMRAAAGARRACSPQTRMHVAGESTLAGAAGTVASTPAGQSAAADELQQRLLGRVHTRSEAANSIRALVADLCKRVATCACIGVESWPEVSAAGVENMRRTQPRRKLFDILTDCDGPRQGGT